MGWLGLAHRLAQLSRGQRARRFVRAAADPAAAQTVALRRILAAVAATEVGRRHQLGPDVDREAFRAAVPLTCHEQLRPLIEREKAGERGVLCGTPPVFYARTSGSAGRPKDVPVTAAFRREFQEAALVGTWFLYRRYPAGFRGHVLYFVGPAELDRAADGTAIGSISGFNYRAMPALVRRLYAWPAELFEIGDLATRSYLALQLAALADVTVIAAIFPSILTALFRFLDDHGAALADDLERGELPAWLALTRAQRARFAARTRPAPAVAARLRRAIAQGTPLPLALMPRLGLVFCWTAASAGAYVPDLERRLGDQVPVRDSVYSASEGWCSVPLGEREPGGALAVTSHFYEFIAVDDYDRGARVTRFADQLDDGGRYYIVLTTSAGLLRYVLGDIVEVVGRFRKTPVIRFVRKAGARCNLAGELLDEDHVTAAVTAALAAIGRRAAYFVAGPERSAPAPRYVLFIEPTDDAPLPAALAARFDRELARACHTYGSRIGGELMPAAVRQLPAGTYAAVRQQLVDGGAVEAQLKVPHLVDDLTRLPSLVVERGRPLDQGSSS